MSNFIECSVEIQNLIMSVMEFCLVLEFILILLRMTGSAHLRRKITVTVLFGVTFLGTVLLQCVQKYDAKALEQSLFFDVPIVVMLCAIAGLTFLSGAEHFKGDKTRKTEVVTMVSKRSSRQCAMRCMFCKCI